MPDPTPSSRFQRFGFDVAVPKWFIGLGLVVGLVFTAFYLYTQWGHDIMDTTPVPKLVAHQLQESQIHFFETPAAHYEPNPNLKYEFFASDSCTAVQHTLPDGSLRPAFVFHPTRMAELASITNPFPVPAQAGIMPCAGPGPGCCLDPHPYPWNTVTTQESDCIVRITRTFEPDEAVHCVSFQDFNVCEETAHNMIWEACVH